MFDALDVSPDSAIEVKVSRWLGPARSDTGPLLNYIFKFKVVKNITLCMHHLYSNANRGTVYLRFQLQSIRRYKAQILEEVVLNRQAIRWSTVDHHDVLGNRA